MKNSVTDSHDETELSTSRYTSIAIALHWVLAIGLIYQLGLGEWMQDIPKTPPGIRAEWFNWHKSIGLLLGLLIVVRTLWRLTHLPPTLPDNIPRWQTLAAHANHALLYLCMVGMPMSGFLGSTFTPYPIKFFGTPLPRLWDASSDMKELFSTAHTTLAYIFIFTIAMHIMAAVWHKLRHDGIFQRMLP
jgi:cytochrome b561